MLTLKTSKNIHILNDLIKMIAHAEERLEASRIGNIYDMNEYHDAKAEIDILMNELRDTENDIIRDSENFSQGMRS